MFVALQSNEKFPDEGFDVDVQSKLCKNRYIFVSVVEWSHVIEKETRKIW